MTIVQRIATATTKHRVALPPTEMLEAWPMVQDPHQNVAQHDAGREKQPQME